MTVAERATVIDASVCLKWYAHEGGSREARQLLHRGTRFSAPDILVAEAGNALWRRTLSREFTAVDAEAILNDLVSGDIVRLEPVAELVPPALRAAIQLRHPIYDCLYLALAEALDAPLVTADRRLAAAVRGTPWEGTVELIGTT